MNDDIPAIVYLEHGWFFNGAVFRRKYSYVMVPRSKIWADDRPEYRTRRLTTKESLMWVFLRRLPKGYRSISNHSNEEAEIKKAMMADLHERSKNGTLPNMRKVHPSAH